MQTMLNEPQQSVIAMTGESAPQAKHAGVFFEPRELADGVAVQVWRYMPCIQAKENNVDLFCLYG